jgi:CBS-domain-containing membrane protein
MSPIHTLLYGDQPAGVTIDFMRQHHMEWVPIVDRDEVFIGLVSTEKLMRMLLPKSIGMMRGIKHASYLRESAQDLDERMQSIREMATVDLVDPHAETVHPDAALTDALMVISNRQYVVPVVDDDGRLVGAISYFSIMHTVEQHLAQNNDPS